MQLNATKDRLSCRKILFLPTMHEVFRGAIILSSACILSACGQPKPGASDIEPYVMAELSNCPLWSVSDVRKLDGIATEDSYQVDFSAKLTLKATPEETSSAFMAHERDTAYLGCHFVIAQLVDVRIRGLPTKKYDISGAGELVKSESGWRLRGELVQLAFSRDAAEWAAVSEGTNRPELKSSTAAVTPPARSEQKGNDQDASTQVSPCVEAKMVAWDKQHSSEVEQAAAAATAAGEEFRSSAGMEELVRNEAIAAATSTCK
ncbi:hypothetical protein GCN74_11035 [Janthinobacterium sp. FT14W]|uniref:hypothetical protein n=1 Tax=Janthinobacterium sp. FT14W TaxID=2654253 RepID=UPI001264F331|nr:hypothetical protein [Janthinobacterium sp. FT14W]KAB8059904.1 hypothetical protein GCN74_11035 [Janthinobacterium sp. FT14W]